MSDFETERFHRWLSAQIYHEQARRAHEVIIDMR